MQTSLPRRWPLGLLAMGALAASSQVVAQVTSVPLACTVPNGANTVTLATNATNWEVNPGTGNFQQATAITSPHGAWTDPAVPAQWIGESSNGAGSIAVGSKGFRVMLQPHANVVPSSGHIAINFKVDDDLTAVTLNGAGLSGNYPYIGSFSAATSVPAASVTFVPGVANPLAVSVYDVGSVWGLNAVFTITYDCAQPLPKAVPMDAPWALLGLGGLLAAGAGFMARRRRCR